MDEKKICITGINNKYNMKKLTEKKEPKKRVVTEKWIFNEIYLQSDKQLELLNCLDGKTNEMKTLVKEIERKIYGYKQQDLEKKVYDSEKFITFDEVTNKMIETQLKCYYCNDEMFILYEMTRENRQWTIDRDNNDKGHNIDNYILACLECNLKRKRRQKDAFLFTKQLNIVKQS